MYGRSLLMPTLLSALLIAVGVAGEPERQVPEPPRADEPQLEAVRALTDADLTELEAIRRAVGPLEGADAKGFRTALRQAAAPTVQMLTPPGAAVHIVEEPPLVTALRQSARHFESVAASAEERGAYREADEARETASRLWIEARRVRD